MGSRVDDSKRVISKLCREINDLRKEARDQSPAKERPRKGPKPSLSPSTHIEAWVETPFPSQETFYSAHRSKSLHTPEERAEHSSWSTNRHCDKNVRPLSAPKKAARRGEQGVVWKALDLVSSSPFSKEIVRVELPKRFTAPKFEAYIGQTDPVAHISHYQQRMALCRYNKDGLVPLQRPSDVQRRHTSVVQSA